MPFRHTRYRDLGGELGGAGFFRFSVNPYRSSAESMSGFESRILRQQVFLGFQKYLFVAQHHEPTEIGDGKPARIGIVSAVTATARRSDSSFPLNSGDE